MRTGLTLLALIGGTALAVISYFVLAAPIGTPTSESFANPRVPFAATLFVTGISLAVLSAILYEVLPEPREA